jgi:molybdate transport system substrate-binding protein
MATAHVLAELGEVYEAKTGQRVSVESMGGVDAAARVRAGGKYDFVALASTPSRSWKPRDMSSPARTATSRARASPWRGGRRARAGHLDRGSRARSRRERADDRFLDRAQRQASRVPVPEWGVAETIGPAPAPGAAGHGVGSLIARGEVELGFQQLSELIHLEAFASWRASSRTSSR